MAGYGSFTYGKAAYGITVIRTDIQASVDASSTLSAAVERLLSVSGTTEVNATTQAAIERIFPIASGGISGSSSTTSSAVKVRLADAGFAAIATWAGAVERVRLSEAQISAISQGEADTTTIVNGVATMRAICSALCGLRRYRNVDGALNATLTFSADAREKWEPIVVSSEAWTPLSQTAEIWTEIA